MKKMHLPALALLWALTGLFLACQPQQNPTTHATTPTSHAPFHTETKPNPSGKLKVFLDVSHGGQDSGSIYSGLMEKDFVFAVSKKIDSLAKMSSSIEVVLSRYADTLPGNYDRVYSQLRRIDLMHASQADVMLSLHSASEPLDTAVKGTQVFVPNRPADQAVESRKLGTAMSNALQGAAIPPWDELLQLKDRGGYVILDANSKPGILVEIGFMTNPHDIAILKDSSKYTEFAQRIIQGLETYAVELKK